MIPSIESQSKYWNNTWNDRIRDDGVAMNGGKAHILLKELWVRHYLAPLEKLDIGCGTGIHAVLLSKFNPLWQEKWTGVDLSEDAIKYAKSFGLNAFCEDVFQFDGDGKKYQAFLFLDSLEHFTDLAALAEKVKSLAASKYIILGNVPLYLSVSHQKGGVENRIDVLTVAKFVENAGCINETFIYKVYGVKGMPYLLFEASNTNSDDYRRWNR